MGRPPAKLAGCAFDAYLVGLNLALRFPGHELRLALLRHVARVEIGACCAVERNLRLTTKGGVRIGAGTNINRGVLLDGRGRLELGEHVNVSPEAMLWTAEHDPRSPDFLGRVRRTVIGDKSWIATRAIILPGATIGTGTVVGAGAVVHGDVPAWVIVAGNPAVVIGERPPTAQSVLPRYRRWWH